MYKWLERRIDPFADFDPAEMPPDSVSAFTWNYLKPVRFWLGVALALSIGGGIIESGIYILVGWFVDLMTNYQPQEIADQYGGMLIAAGIVVLVLRPIIFFCHEAILSIILAPQTVALIRWRAHLYTLRHALGYFQADFAGRLANRILQAGHAIRDIAVMMLECVVYVGVFAVTALVMFARISVWLMLPMALWIVFFVILMWFFLPRAKERSLAVADARSVLSGRIVDSYTNILTVKLFARGEHEQSAVRRAMESVIQTSQYLVRLIVSVDGILLIMNSALLVATAAFSFVLWGRGLMTPGEGAAGLALVLRILAMSGWVMYTMRSIFDQIGMIQESMHTIAKPHALIDHNEAVELSVNQGLIEFKDVSFDYGLNRDVIHQLNLTVRPGEKVGLVGRSGAGKSTIVSLLLRLHDIEKGRILIDGQDIATVTQDSLRRQIAVVTQDTSLLHRSVRDNIAYGRPDASDAEIIRAARMAHAETFISELEDHMGRKAYDARVGERGVKLSGGQRQRIAIARVILKNAPILVLDEATSALDSEIEVAIQDALETLMAGKTVIAIAHRLSTIAALDRLIVLDAGEIAEEGTHAELLERCGIYAKLWQHQSGGFLGV